MSAAIDARIGDARLSDALVALPHKVNRALTHQPYRPCLESLVDELHENETVRALSCGVSSSLGRGVIALTDDRLIFCCSRSGATSWTRDEVQAVDGRPGRFTLDPAIYLYLGERRMVFALGVGRSNAPRFVGMVRDALAPQ